jgi:bacterioferritin-associated ferredoxin
MRDLIRTSRRIRDAAVRAYVEQRVRLRTRELRRETDAEVARCCGRTTSAVRRLTEEERCANF